MTEHLSVNKKESFIKSIFKFSISTWINFIISLVTVVITTRIFTPDIFGIINVFNVTSSVILSFLIMGLDSSYIRFYNEPPGQDNSKVLVFKLVSFGMILTIAIGFIITTFFYEPFTEIIFNRSSWFISVMVFISVLSNLIFRYLNITYRMSFNIRQYTIQSILVQLFAKTFVLFAALINPVAETVIAFNVMGLFILAIIYLFIQRKDIVPKRINLSLKGYKPIFLYAIFTAPLFISVNLNNFFSQQIIVNTISVSAVGIYTSASYFATILTVLQGGFSNFWSAFMFSKYKEEQTRIKNMHDYVMFLLLLALIGMIVFKDLIYILVGPQYHESKSFFVLVLMYPILAIASETTVYGLSIEKKNHITLINYLISIIFNLALSLILTKYFGLTGAAVASCISGTVLFSLNTYWGQRYYKSVNNIKKTVLCVVLMIACAISVTIIKNILVLLMFIVVVLILMIILYRDIVKNLIVYLLTIIKKRK